MFWHKHDRFYISVDIDDYLLYGSLGLLIDTTVLGPKTKFDVTNIGQLHWNLRRQIT
jgi:hypothetical protein